MTFSINNLALNLGNYIDDIKTAKENGCKIILCTADELVYEGAYVLANGEPIYRGVFNLFDEVRQERE